MAEAYNPAVVNEVIAEAVTRPGWSQARLARALGLRPQTVNKWVSGENTPPVERWRAIEMALELPETTLFKAAGIVAPVEPAMAPTRAAMVGTIFEALEGAERLSPERRAQLLGYLERLLDEQAADDTK